MNQKKPTKPTKTSSASRSKAKTTPRSRTGGKPGLSKPSTGTSSKTKYAAPKGKPSNAKAMNDDTNKAATPVTKRKEYQPARKPLKSAAERKAESWIDQKPGEQPKPARKPREGASTKQPRGQEGSRQDKTRSKTQQYSDKPAIRSGGSTKRLQSDLSRRNSVRSEESDKPGLLKRSSGFAPSKNRVNSIEGAATRGRSKPSNVREPEGKFSRKAKERQISFAQNFVKNPALVRKIVGKSSISPSSTVIEIGPGKGVLTRELAKASKNVIAIEKDPVLFQELKKQFSKQSNVALIQGDFLLRKDKLAQKIVFANPPFNLFSRIMQKLLWSEGVPEHVYMFGQREAVNRFCGAGRDFVNHILLSPWFTPKVVYRFERTDFVPVPSVDVVLLHIRPRPTPLLPRSQQRTYTDFVQFGYRFSSESLSQVYRRIFTPKQWYRLATDCGFDEAAKARELTRDQWVQLFTFYSNSVDPARRRLVR